MLEVAEKICKRRIRVIMPVWCAIILDVIGKAYSDGLLCLIWRIELVVASYHYSLCGGLVCLV